ncbi:hypothetical protein [Methylovulum psychrotolerans]|nr:hypothetical protein [Methylovulum psychrotolerans]
MTKPPCPVVDDSAVVRLARVKNSLGHVIRAYLPNTQPDFRFLSGF